MNPECYTLVHCFKVSATMPSASIEKVFGTEKRVDDNAVWRGAEGLARASRSRRTS